MTVPARSAERLPLVDALRGIAIVAMVAYHFTWDLSYLGFLGYDISSDMGWVIFQRTILGSFLVLVGVGLVLGHGEGVRWRAFWRRFGILVAAAMAMSIGTYVAFGDAFSFFGILHAIALFSLMGLAFLRLPVWAIALAAAAFVVPAIVFHSDAFNVRHLAWIGFWTIPPRTADLVAVFPWFGAVLGGIAAGKLLPRTALARWRLRDPISRSLALAGRWSLVIYLLHQPLLLGVLMPLADVMKPGELSPREAFVQSCEPSCLESGGVIGYCQAYCACAVETIEAQNLWDTVNAQSPTPEQGAKSDAVIELCRAMAE